MSSIALTDDIGSLLSRSDNAHIVFLSDTNISRYITNSHVNMLRVRVTTLPWWTSGMQKQYWVKELSLARLFATERGSKSYYRWHHVCMAMVAQWNAIDGFRSVHGQWCIRTAPHSLKAAYALPHCNLNVGLLDATYIKQRSKLCPQLTLHTPRDCIIIRLLSCL